MPCLDLHHVSILSFPYRSHLSHCGKENSDCNNGFCVDYLCESGQVGSPCKVRDSTRFARFAVESVSLLWFSHVTSPRILLIVTADIFAWMSEALNHVKPGSVAALVRSVFHSVSPWLACICRFSPLTWLASVNVRCLCMLG